MALLYADLSTNKTRNSST